MAQTVVVNGVNYTIPDVGEEDWGQNVTDYLVALAVIGSLSQSFMNAVTVTTSPVTVVSGRTYLVDTSAARTLTLPAAALNAFFLVRDKTGGAASFNITIARAGTESIDGTAANKTLKVNNGYWLFMCDGTNWFTLNLKDDYVDSLTPTAPADAGTSLTNRLAMLAYQMQRLNVTSGNWYDAFGWLSAITPAAPGATATDLLNRLAQIAYQLKAILGTTNWHDTVTDSLLYAGLESISATQAIGKSITLADATSADVTLTLPTAVGCAGRVYRVKKTDSGGNAVIINTTSSQTIDGDLDYTLGVQYECLAVVSDGANWHIMSKF